ncbi:MAG: MarR family transcriptional regulator, partial [Spirochaetota bacterium]
MGFVSSKLRRNVEVDNAVHFRLLRTLRRGPRSLHELADLHEVRLPTMSRTVTVLQSRGWVNRTRSEDDRRTVFTSLTE